MITRPINAEQSFPLPLFSSLSSLSLAEENNQVSALVSAFLKIPPEDPSAKSLSSYHVSSNPEQIKKLCLQVLKVRNAVREQGKEALLKTSRKHGVVIGSETVSSPLSILYGDNPQQDVMLCRSLWEGDRKKIKFAINLTNSELQVAASSPCNKHKGKFISPQFKEVAIKQALAEVKILKHYQGNPRVVQLLFAREEEKKVPYTIEKEVFWRMEKRVSWVMEYCEQGDLFEWLKGHADKGEDLTQEEKLQSAEDILEAVLTLYENQHIHRDLKFENFFIIANDRIKIGDFGFTCHQDDKESRRQNLATPEMMPPEQVRAFQSLSDIVDNFNKGNRTIGEVHAASNAAAATITHKIDAWAIGLILFSLFNKGHLDIDPLGRIDRDELPNCILSLKQKQLDQEIDSRMPRELKEFFKGLLQIDPEKRWDVKRAKEAFLVGAAKLREK